MARGIFRNEKIFFGIGEVWSYRQKWSKLTSISRHWHCCREGKRPSQNLTSKPSKSEIITELIYTKGLLKRKHCQRHNGPKALSTLTHSTPLVQSRNINKLWNFYQTLAYFFWHRAKSTQNFDKSMLQLRDIHVGENSQPKPESDVMLEKSHSIGLKKIGLK